MFCKTLTAQICHNNKAERCQSKYLLLHDGARALGSVSTGLHGGNLYTNITVRSCLMAAKKSKHLSQNQVEKIAYLVGDLDVLHDGAGDLDSHLLGLHVDLNMANTTH
jgi:hypothetical protein